MTISRLLVVALLTVAAVRPARAQEESMKKLTPVLLVEEIEACLPVWEALGFERTVEVPEGGRLGFVSLQSGPVEIMYQSRASLANDLPVLAEGSYTRDGLSLFIEVEDLDDVKGRLAGVPRIEELFPERTTFYGAREIGFRTTCGTHVVFAEFAPEDDSED